MRRIRPQRFAIAGALLVTAMLCPRAIGQDTQYGPTDEHGKLLLMAPSYDRSGAVGFRCVMDAVEQ